jgi:Restriction endonuclease NaeI
MPAQTSDSKLDEIEKELRAIPDYQVRIRESVARAVDEVVDPVRSNRWRVSDLTQPEKTVIGIRVEHVLTMELGFDRAKRKELDVVIAGQNVDIKFTIGSNWQIPPEVYDHDGICLVVRFDERTLQISAGLVRASIHLLNVGENRDKKKTLSAEGRRAIRWLVDTERPKRSVIGFMASCSDKMREYLTDPTVAAQERVNRLFLGFLNKPIPEEVVQAVEQHVDWGRRLRRDRSKSKAPEKRGYEVVRSGSPWRKKQLLMGLGLPPLEDGYCVGILTRADVDGY